MRGQRGGRLVKEEEIGKRGGSRRGSRGGNRGGNGRNQGEAEEETGNIVKVYDELV